jgi:hypothetical protein
MHFNELPDPEKAKLMIGIVSWALAGLICDCGVCFEFVKAARADLLGEDGIIHG